MSFLFAILAGILAIPVFIFCVEILAAISVPWPEVPAPKNGFRPRIAVLVPAHNEGSGLRETLGDVQAQLRPTDRILVVADNCSDDTATVAKSAGAEVTERHDPAKMGKGYALHWGLKYLSVDPPEIVIMLDADCRMANHSLDWLAAASAATRRPAQALNLMSAPPASPINFQVAEFAFRVKNLARPLGLRALNLPCQLMGTGMAFPWEQIQSADLASAEAVEDLKLGLDLARAGHPPLFCPSAAVSSQFPLSARGAKSQRERWEQGHLGMIARIAPRLFCESLAQGNLRLLALTLDAAVPPLTMLGVLVSLMLFVSGLGILLGLSPVALLISVSSWVALCVAAFLSWLKFGRDILPPRSVISLATYAVGKFPLYYRILSRRGGSGWTKTDRGK